MNRPVVIVDPLSSGIELAPAFKARGIPAIAVTLGDRSWIGFGSKIQPSDFIKIIPDQPNLLEILKTYHPIAVIAGTEEGVPLAEWLTQRLTPDFSNDGSLSQHRLHKALMQQALVDAGLPFLQTLNSSSIQDVEAWLLNNHLDDAPLIVKPPMSAGSDKVFHIAARGDWKTPFYRILNEPSNVTGIHSETVVVQEQAIGIEFAVGTVSANGEHHLAHIIQYHKTNDHGRHTIFDYVEFIAYDDNKHRELWMYTQKVLDALGVRWGAAHTEIMLTDKGPRLIELGARMCGGPTVGFARAATGSSQADKLVEAYVDGGIRRPFDFKKPVVPVFLKSPAKGIISNIETFMNVAQLSTFHNKYLWFSNGDLVPQTVDYLTSIGIVALSGDRNQIMQDYHKIRHMESAIRVTT